MIFDCFISIFVLKFFVYGVKFYYDNAFTFEIDSHDLKLYWNLHV